MISRLDAEERLKTETRKSVTRYGRVVVPLDDFLKDYLIAEGYLKIHGPGLYELTELGAAWCGAARVANT